PIFRWFQSWCHDEFRHGDVFALILRANPELLRGANRLWIRFFLLAVYATMYVRDHERPNMHRAMGLDPDAFAYRVFDITTDISGQIFPLKLNTDDPRFRAGLDRLQRISAAAARARAQGGVVGAVKQAACWLGGAATFGRLYLLPVQDNELPPRVRMAPSW
ncbi:MAG: magnesium-protoporphyrin IX monomethyl ester (oxidative) cyclase, partial [Pseudomonadota bacterium]